MSQSDPPHAAATPVRSALPPVVLSTYADPLPLTGVQQEEIARRIELSGKNREDVWFLYVRANRDEHWWVTIYFRPTRQDGRLQEGESLFFNGDIPAAIIEDIWKDQKKGPFIHQYVRVAPLLEEDANRPPAEADVPFDVPEGIGKSEIVAVIDTARAAMQRPGYSHEDTVSPVRSINMREDGKIEVRFGWQSGMLNGRGSVVVLKPAGGRFVVEPGFGMWMS